MTMHIKYFQGIADIRNHYDDILRNFDNEKFGHALLKTWGISLEEKEVIMEEREVLRYLLSCKHGFTYEDDVQKPSLEIVERCFNRHLAFLEEIHNCHINNVNKHPSKLVQKEYKACRHYLFKFSLKVWYEKLPNEILSFESRYGQLKDIKEY